MREDREFIQARQRLLRRRQQDSPWRLWTLALVGLLAALGLVFSGCGDTQLPGGV